eukprot:GGOE01000148.1.p3 GENE.GGOE01000148.1~~GGOE01000148.1.p3  ORF type:complete len:216 (+),score=3.29 GGOE01000148.1:59-706(+)
MNVPGWSNPRPSDGYTEGHHDQTGQRAMVEIGRKAANVPIRNRPWFTSIWPKVSRSVTRPSPHRVAASECYRWRFFTTNLRPGGLSALRGGAPAGLAAAGGEAPAAAMGVSEGVAMGAEGVGGSSAAAILAEGGAPPRGTLGVTVIRPRPRTVLSPSGTLGSSTTVRRWVVGDVGSSAVGPPSLIGIEPGDLGLGPSGRGCGGYHWGDVASIARR